MRRRDGGTDRETAPEMRRPSPMAGAGQFPVSADAAPAGLPRKQAPGRRRGSARGYNGPLPGAG
jgi:hypothetical protein